MVAGDPAAAAMSDPASLVSPAPPGGQPSARRVMSVLLVEDDRSDARLLTEFLRRSRFFDHAITAAGDQDAAIALSREKPFDLVILDYWLRTQASLPLSPGWSAAFPAVPILLDKRCPCQLSQPATTRTGVR